MQYSKMPRSNEKFICAPQFKFNSGGTLRIIFIFWLKYVIKDLWICVQSFGKISWPVFDLSTSRKIDTIWAKVCMSDPGLKGLNALIVDYIPADTDVFETSSGRFKKVTTSYDQTRRCHHVWKKTSDLRRLEDVCLRRLEDVQFTMSWRCSI